MSLPLPIAAALSVLLGSMLLVSVPSAAVAGSTARRGGTSSPDLAIRHGSSGFVGGGYIDDTADYEEIGVTAAPGASMRFVLRVRNTGGTDSIRLAGAGPTTDIDVTYLAGLTGTKDITDEVVAGTRVITDLAAGHVRYLRLLLTVHSDADPQVGHWQTTATSVSYPTRVDAVRATVMVPAVTTSALNATGELRCSASFASTTVDPGTLTGAVISVTNETRHPVDTPAWYATLRFTDGSGSVLGDTGNPYLGRFAFPRTIRPGHTVPLYVYDTLVRWPGSLDIVPMCWGLDRHAMSLPPVTVEITVPTPAPRPAGAVNRAVAATHGLFDTCNPDGRGRPVVGTFEVPVADSDDEPLSTRCWAKVREYPGFDVVTLSFISPQDLSTYEVDQDEPEFEFDGIQYLPAGSSAVTARWDFVVTADAAHSYGFASQARTNGADRFATSYLFYDGDWVVGGEGRCGYQSYSFGWGVDVFYLDWVNGCPATHARTTAARGSSGWTSPEPGVLVRLR
jgi:hypothetical protein